MNKYGAHYSNGTSNNKKYEKYTIKDVHFDTSKYVENKPCVIKKIPLKL